MIILGKVRPLSRHLIEAHPQVSIIAPFSVRKPGGVLSPSEVQWDMSVCHWYFFDFGNHYGGVPVGAYGLKQGQPIAQWGY
jgi:hypothetical protein